MPASLCGALPAGRCRELVLHRRADSRPAFWAAIRSSPAPSAPCRAAPRPPASALCLWPRRGGGKLGHRSLVTSFVDPNPTVALSVICTKYYIFPDPKPTAALSNPTVALSFTFFQNSSSRRVRKGILAVLRRGAALADFPAKTTLSPNPTPHRGLIYSYRGLICQKF